jgi:hypothetical protein
VSASLLAVLVVAWTVRATGAELVSKTAIGQMLRSDATPPAEFDAYFDEYFKNFVTPKSPFSIDDLPKLRRDFKIYLRTAAKSPAPHDRLNEIAYKKLTVILPSKALPTAVRYNALLMLGDLNEDDSKNIPWAKPFNVLMAVLKSPPSEKIPEYLKVAALIGVERYATLKAIPKDKASDLNKSLLELLGQQNPPAGRDPVVHNWMRRSAGQVLVLVGNPGADGSVVKAMAEVVNDPSARPTIRADMAQFLGQLQYPAESKVDFKALANSVGHEVVDICRQELEAADAGSRAPSRKLLAYVLTSASVGLAGSDGKGGLLAASAAAPEQQKFIETLRSKVKPLADSVDGSGDDGESLSSEMAPMLAALEGALVPRAEAPDKPAEPPKKPEAAQAAVDAQKVGR